VPVGLLAALATVAIGGGALGGGGLSALRQLVGGPVVPLAESGRGTSTAENPRASLPSIPRDAVAATRPGTTNTTSARERRSSRREVERRRTTEVPASTTPGTTPTPPTGTTPTPPNPPSPPPSGPVRRVGEAVRDTVRPIPAAGPVAADAIDTVLAIIDPPPKPRIGLP
jgi:hypothetical protein